MTAPIQLFKSCTFQPLPEDVSLPGSPAHFELEPWWLPGWWGGATGCREAAGRILGALKQHGSWSAISTVDLVEGWKKEHYDRILGSIPQVPSRSKLDHYNGWLILGRAVDRLVQENFLGHSGPQDRPLVWPTLAFLTQADIARRAR